MKRSSRRGGLTLVLLCIAATLIPAVAWAVPCGTGQVQVTRTRDFRYYQINAAGPWHEGWFSWYRDATYDCWVETTTTIYCFNSSWDAFWGINIKKKVSSSTEVMVGTREGTDNEWDCGDTAPPDDWFSEKWLELEDPAGISSNSPGSIPHAFAQVGETIGRSGEGLELATAGFSEAVQEYGSRFVTSAGILDELYFAAIDVSNPKQARLDEILNELATAFGEMGNAMLDNAVPTDSEPFENASNLLAELAIYPALQDEANWSDGFPHLEAAAETLALLAGSVAGGIDSDDEQWDFLGKISEMRLSLIEFAIALDAECNDVDGDGSCSVDDCDPVDAATYPGAPEVNDGADNQCPGDPGFGEADELSGSSTFEGVDTFCWAAQGGATSYEVAVSEQPDFSGTCQTEVVQSTCAGIPDTPSDGGGLYVLVRALTPLPGSWGENGQGDERNGTCP
ncbi:MAG: hypothetical protein GY716_18070 [bacterium]|nr:hypothetical protein [bacterium]